MQHCSYAAEGLLPRQCCVGCVAESTLQRLRCKGPVSFSASPPLRTCAWLCHHTSLLFHCVPSSYATQSSHGALHLWRISHGSLFLPHTSPLALLRTLSQKTCIHLLRRWISFASLIHLFLCLHHLLYPRAKRSRRVRHGLQVSRSCVKRATPPTHTAPWTGLPGTKPRPKSKVYIWASAGCAGLTGLGGLGWAGLRFLLSFATRAVSFRPRRMPVPLITYGLSEGTVPPEREHPLYLLTPHKPPAILPYRPPL